MRKNIEPLSWQADLAAFGKRNNMRPTRLEVLGPERDVESDFWLEDGLLLAGVDLDTDGERGTCGEIMLQAPSTSNKNHMTRTVAGVWRVEKGRVLTEPFAPLPRVARRELADEAERLQAWLG